jgi:hypothetical protein
MKSRTAQSQKIPYEQLNDAGQFQKRAAQWLAAAADGTEITERL